MPRAGLGQQLGNRRRRGASRPDRAEHVRHHLRAATVFCRLAVDPFQDFGPEPANPSFKLIEFLLTAVPMSIVGGRTAVVVV